MEEVQDLRRIYIALPVMDEEAFIQQFLNSIEKQSYKAYKLFACVNQPESWWKLPDKLSVCESNKRVSDMLKTKGFTVIDRTSKGNGWTEKDSGVGWARKTAMDFINREAQADDIILSIDADTIFNENYFSSVVKLLTKNSDKLALSNPYFHNLTGEDKLDRAMLRYEIYMRCYALNMHYIQSPFAFTALGSAIALPVWAYRKIGGITPKKSGEDFYFLQKLRKAGKIITWNTETVFPATRYSDRVFFGTGPALIKGSSGNWSSYPIYHRTLFDDIKHTYELFDLLFIKDMPTPIDDFLNVHFGKESIWAPLRKNAKTINSFKAACHQKIDGLRILQYLKWKASKINMTDEESLIDFLEYFFQSYPEFDKKTFSFEKSPVPLLDSIRNFLFEKELEAQYNDSFNTDFN